jgi:hypothetical protein
MAQPARFRLEELENRTVPAIFGIPWPDASHLTLSFAPDGTAVGGVGSSLFGTMQAAGLSTSAWQEEILRAVQTWSQNANINVGVVADSGDPIGTPGASEGDSRFGDIRISARPLSDNVLAITTPPGYLGGTLVGDIILNSNVAFSIGGGGSSYDLYSAMLQETGHAFGISNSLDPNSPMFETYSGVRSGLTAGDIANIQSLYGARSADFFEGPVGNDSMATARDLSVLCPLLNYASPVLPADISSPTDIDYYKLQALSGNPNDLTIQLNASTSLLAPKVTVFDSSGNIISTAQSVDPTSPGFTLTLPAVTANTNYFVKVEAANPAFGVGAYQLTIVSNPSAPVLQWNAASATPINDNQSNDTIDSATKLYTAAGHASNTYFTELATIRDTTDVDYYRFRSPLATANQPNELLITVSSLSPGNLAPAVQVYSKDKQLVPATILANGDGTYSVQIPNAASNQVYYVQVLGQNGSVGTYQLTADFHSQLINQQQLAAGTLSDASNTAFTTLSINRSQMMYFTLTAGAAPAGTTAGVRMAIFDSNGHVVGTRFARAGETISTSFFLAPGDYTVRFEGLAPAEVALPNLAFALQGFTLTDPIAPVSLDPGLDGSGLAPTPDFVVVQQPDIFYWSIAFDWLGDVTW